MEYTDGLLKLPVKLYDKADMVRKANRSELLNLNSDYDTPKWMRAEMELPPQEIKALIDTFSKERDWDDIKEEGFDSCIIVTNTMGEFECPITKSEIKKRLNSFMGNYEKVLKVHIESTVQDKELEMRKLLQSEYEDVGIIRKILRKIW